MRFTRGSYKMRQKPCDALNFAPVCMLCRWSFGFDMLQAFYRCADFCFWASERCKIIMRFSDIIPDPANVMQFADVSFALMQTLLGGKVPSNELMLHKTMQCTGASCKAHQNAANTEQFCANTTQPRDSNTKGAKYCTLICLAFGFWPFHSREGTVFTLYIYGFCTEDACTHGCLHTWVLLHRDAFGKGSLLHTNLVLLRTNAFMHRCLYTGMLLHSRAFKHRCPGISTHRCLYTGMFLHRNAFTH